MSNDRIKQLEAALRKARSPIASDCQSFSTHKALLAEIDQVLGQAAPDTPEDEINVRTITDNVYDTIFQNMDLGDYFSDTFPLSDTESSKGVINLISSKCKFQITIKQIGRLDHSERIIVNGEELVVVRSYENGSADLSPPDKNGRGTKNWKHYTAEQLKE